MRNESLAKVSALSVGIDKNDNRRYSHDDGSGERESLTSHKQDVSRPAFPTEKMQTELAAIMSGGDEDRVIAGIDYILAAGAREQASDIHLEPFADGLRIRFRIDGVLVAAARLSKECQENLVARLKVISQLVTYRKKLPQDGRTKISVEGQGVDLRFSFFPTLHGEKVVIRFMSSSRPLRDIGDLGFPEDIKADFLERLERNQGTILLTGPAGSGKTTTLYAALRHVQRAHGDGRNIMTIEDPVEYDLGDIAQSQVSPVAGITFSSGLRSLLRQDPNVIMIGEIRDRETAEIAVQAGLTGHLILSTIHSGSSVGVFTRLINLDIEPYLVASSITAILAQRLVPVICAHCKERYEPAPGVLKRIPGRERFHGFEFQRGKGCAECRGSGVGGRVGLFELLRVDDKVRELMLKAAPPSKIMAALRKKGMKTIVDQGLEKVLTGTVAIEEVLRAA